jgi:hypothetical protein
MMGAPTGQNSKPSTESETGICMHLLNPSMRTQEMIHRRGFSDMRRYTTKLDVDQERQNMTMGTGQTTPLLALKLKPDELTSYRNPTRRSTKAKLGRTSR